MFKKFKQENPDPAPEAAAAPQGAPPVAPPTGGPSGPPPSEGPPAGAQAQDPTGAGGGTIGTGTVPNPGEQGFSGNVQ